MCKQAKRWNKDERSLRLPSFFDPQAVLAQLSRHGPITKEETITTILSEDALTLSIFLALLKKNSDDAEFAQFRSLVAQTMKDALSRGYIDPQMDKKLAIIEQTFSGKNQQRVLKP